MKNLLLTISLLSSTVFNSATGQNWSVLAENVVTFSSPRPVDLTGDGILDIVIGGGVDGQATAYGVTGINGNTGDTIWTVPSTNEIFGSAIFQDITGDNVEDVFIGGRSAQFYAINGSTGEVIWDVYSNMTTPFPSEPKLLCFFQGQWIPDQDNDGKQDIVISYGGDNSAPEWVTDRPAGMLIIISAATGEILGRASVPDGKETYMSPVVTDLESDNIVEILYGTGGETIGGGFYWASIENILEGSLPAAQILVSNTTKGFIAPPAIADFTADSQKDIAVQGFDGSFYIIDGTEKTVALKIEFPGTECGASPVIGNFTGDITPDIFLALAKGTVSSYSDYYQIMIDGKSGSIVMKDSIGDMVFPSPVAFDYNGDGRDEVLLSYNYKDNNNLWKHLFKVYDFQNDSHITLFPDGVSAEPGVNVISTPLVADLDSDNFPDLIYSIRKDDQNPGAPNGFYVKRIELTSTVPSAGIAFGSYMGTGFDGHYTYNGKICDGIILISAATPSNTSCNSTDDGKIIVTVDGGTGPYNYIWSDGSIQKDLLNVSDGTYTLRVTDATGCISEVTRTINDRYTITKNAVNNTCPDGTSGSASISSTGCACMTSNCTYLWSNGGTAKTISGLTSGTYYATITHGDGCKAYDSVTVGPTAIELLTSYIPESTAGNDGIAIVSASGGTPPYSYLWDDLLAQTNDTATGLNSDVYTVHVTDNNNCTASASVNIISGSKQAFKLAVKAFPNPSSGEVLFELPGNPGTANYQIHTIAGELVSEGIFSGNSWKINKLPQGVYMIRLNTEKGFSVQKVIIK